MALDTVFTFSHATQECPACGIQPGVWPARGHPSHSIDHVAIHLEGEFRPTILVTCRYCRYCIGRYLPHYMKAPDGL